MSVHWSSELIKWEFKDLHATAMSVDWSGKNVLLAGRRCLAIKQLCSEEDINDSIKKFSRRSKYDAAGAEWCQTQQGQRLCAISSNQRVDVYHWRNGDLTCTNSLREHTRAVSDTHWHRQDHNLLATCSIDTFTHLWDLRDTRKPVLSLCAVAGASQVQWNKVASNILATAHDGDIKIWDKRKGSSPVHYISAHLCKIHGLDWSPHHEYQLVTSSHDGSIKYFDINNPRRAESTITTNFPVWRAMYTPFGSGLITVGVGWGGVARVDQAGVIGIWVGGTLTHRLVGHADMVLQMQWKPNTSPSNYQLVTWARDQTLRVWAMHPVLLKMCNHYLPEDRDVEDDTISETLSYASATESLLGSSLNESSQEIQMVKFSSQKSSDSLGEEFESLRDMANVVVTDMSMDARTCTIRSEGNDLVANLQVTFPQSTSELCMPHFAWLVGTTIEAQHTIKILQAINLTAYQKVRAGQPCLIHCLKTLRNCIDQIPVKTKDDDLKNNTSVNGENAGDACIPYPRTCGAKWCSVGTLVVFNNPPNARRISLRSENGTPRSLSSLTSVQGSYGSYNSVSPHSTLTPSPTNSSGFPQIHRQSSHAITTFYFQDRWKTPSRRSGNRGRGNVTSTNLSRVVIYDADNLFYINKRLAEQYIIKESSPIEMCEYNATVASANGRQDLVQTWQLASLAAMSLQDYDKREQKNHRETISSTFETSEESIAWSTHPFGFSMVQSLINHYAKIHDIQTAAMLCCVFKIEKQEPENGIKCTNVNSNSFHSGAVSPYNGANQINEVTIDGWAVPFIKRNRSNSWSDVIDGYSLNSERTYHVVNKVETPVTNHCTLDETTVHQYHCFLKIYADILHRWNLLDSRTQVMKHVTNKNDTPAKHLGIELFTECFKCKNIMKESRCFKCSIIILKCVICNIGVRGPANTCLACGHGGHTRHLHDWFSRYEVCPTGCGCRCMRETSSIWKENGYDYITSQ